MRRISIDGQEYDLINDYKDNQKYRWSFNQLVRKTYNFDFEEWYQQGYWTEKYRPYSLLYNDEIIANVSVNPIDFLIDKELRSALQIGTVMTDEAFRYKGLSRRLMEIVIGEYENSCDLIYLYANDTVLNFYPKFGFVKEDEYIYTKKVKLCRKNLSVQKLNPANKEDMTVIVRLVTNSIPVSRYQMIHNPELILFYLTSWMSESIYYIKEMDLAAVVEMEEDRLYLIDVFSQKYFDLDDVISSLVTKEGVKVTLGFTPLNIDSYICEKLNEAGSTFFMKGSWKPEKGSFPILSHA